MKKSVLTIPFLALSFIAFSQEIPPEQQKTLDSLWNIWTNRSAADTTRLKAMKQISWDGYLYTHPDSAFYFAQLQYDLAKEKNIKEYMANALTTQGVSLYVQGDYTKAIDYDTRSLKLREEIGDKKGIAASLINIGNIYSDQGDHAKAIDYYTKGLKIFEELLRSHPELVKVKNGMATSLNNIGALYGSQGDYANAIEYQTRSLQLREEIGDRKGIAMSLKNIGDIYKDQAELAKSRNDKSGSDSLFFKATEYQTQGLKLREEIGDKQGIASSLNSIAHIYEGQGNYSEALAFGQRSLTIATEMGAAIEKRDAAKTLWEINKKVGSHQKALEMYELYITTRDTLQSEEKQREVLRQEYKYEYEKKEAVEQAKQEEKDAIAAEELRRQKLVRNGFMGGFALVAAFAGIFLFQRNRIGKEKDRSEELLLNILPEEVAEELKEKGEAEARHIDQVTVLFTDFKGFTAMSEQLTPKDLVKDLNECFSAFDRIVEKHGIEKIKTIGDAYMAAGGLPVPNTTHALDVIQAALEMRDFIAEGKARKIAADLPYFEIRIGIHTGPVVAGIVGVKKFQYDIWGDTVNTASRMESSSEVGQVNISEATYALMKDAPGLSFTPRGKVQAKGKGEMKMFFVDRAKAAAS
ncbi:MAG: tetratricopeptide repeat protein [Flavobacteriales bacterium]|nr:tetratricopeptide repeat protein [Flavobacteriales bacterium]